MHRLILSLLSEIVFILILSGCGMAIETTRLDSAKYESTHLLINLQKTKQYDNGTDFFLFFIPMSRYSDDDVANKKYPYSLNLQIVSIDTEEIIDLTKSTLYVNDHPYHLIGSEIIEPKLSKNKYDYMWVRDCSIINNNYPFILKHMRRHYSNEHLNYSRNYYDSLPITDLCRNKKTNVALGVKPIIKLEKGSRHTIKLLYDYNGKYNINDNDLAIYLNIPDKNITIHLDSKFVTRTITYGAQGYKP